MLAFVIASLVFNKNAYLSQNRKKNGFLSAFSVAATVIYLIIEIISGLMVMIIPDFPINGGIILQIIILACYFIALISFGYYKKTVKSENSDQILNQSNIRSMILLSKEAALTCADSEMKKEIDGVMEALTYSDPVSSPQTLNQECEIFEYLNDIKNKCNNSENIKIITTLCNEIKSLLAQRNLICADSKKLL